MFSKAQPKRLGQDVVTGGVLAALATAYVNAINAGAVPTIATAWQARLPCCAVERLRRKQRLKQPAASVLERHSNRHLSDV